MRYYLDCEFDGFGGELLTLALVSEKGSELYFYLEESEARDPWVRQNVVPVMLIEPIQVLDRPGAGRAIAELMDGDDDPEVIADYPTDFQHFCDCLVIGPNQLASIWNLRMRLERGQSYPTDLPGAVQHNALWDARALKHRLEKNQ
jgi:hypothetical protein